MLNDEEASVRETTVNSLGNIMDDVALDPLINCLEDNDHIVRYLTAQTLRKLSNKSALNPLILALKREIRMKDSAKGFYPALVEFSILQALIDIGNAYNDPNILKLCCAFETKNVVEQSSILGLAPPEANFVLILINEQMPELEVR